MTKTESQSSSNNTDVSSSLSAKNASHLDPAKGKWKGRSCCNISTILKVLLVCGIIAIGIAALALAILGIALLTIAPLKLAFLAAAGSSFGASFGSGVTTLVIFLAPIKIPCLICGPCLLVLIGFGAGSYKVYCLFRAKLKERKEQTEENSQNLREQQKLIEGHTPWYRGLRRFILNDL